MRVLVASTNEKKLKELRALAEGLSIEIVSSRNLASKLPPVEEDGATFVENACKKAKAFALASGLPCVADDSGLCVDSLGGAPGVRSARYSGDEIAPDRDQRNNEKLLRALKDVAAARRSARFWCALCVARPSGETRVVEASWDGQIAFSPLGTGGFGYDPIFLIPHLGKTSAELSPEEKNVMSHRAQAMRLLRPVLEELLG